MLTSTLRDHIPALQTYVSQLVAPLGIQQIRDTDLMLTAFIHKSYAMDYTTPIDHNERLEFLGDGILGAVINTQLYLDYPELEESTLTLYKIALVREETLAMVARQIGLQPHLILGNGEQRMLGREKNSVLADAVEALIGYISLDAGFTSAQVFVLHYIYPHIHTAVQTPVKSAKSRLQEHIQLLYKQLPEYVSTDHEIDAKGNVLVYRSDVSFGGKILGTGYASSKKAAQEAAAQVAMENL